MTQRTYNSNFSKKTFSLTPKKNKIEQEELFILRNKIFNDETYSNLKYDENEIFHKVIFYSNFNKLKENKTENLTTFVKRNFNENNYDLNDGKIISCLKIKSMKIELINLIILQKKNIF